MADFTLGARYRVRNRGSACDTRGVFDTVLAANFSDPVHARIIDRAVLGLVVLAAVVLVATVVWWRSTRSEHPVLAPLEVMGKRRFRFADDSLRAEVLDAVRPGPLQGDDDLVVSADEAESVADHEEAVEPLVADVAEEAPGDGEAVVAEMAEVALGPTGAAAVAVNDVLADFADLLPVEGAEVVEGGAVADGGDAAAAGEVADGGDSPEVP